MTPSESPPHSTLDRKFVLGFCIGQGVNLVKQNITNIKAYNAEVLALVNAFLVQVLQQHPLTQEEAEDFVAPQISMIAELNSLFNLKELR